MTKKSKIILGIVGAAAAGVVVGLLLAPEKGTELRRTIQNTTGSWADHLADMFTNAKGEVENLRKKGSRAADDAASKFNSTKESYS
ncbi:MAG: YtxH domain-containing protein [Chitinophagaceae bacterium]